MECLFVYGTLLKHFDHEVIRPLAPYLQHSGSGLVKGRLYDMGSYPGLVEDPNGYDVYGEIYRVTEPQRVFAELDEYEGSEYIRRKMMVRSSDNEQIRCWVYLYQDALKPKHKEIINGDYLAFVRNKVNNG